MPVLKAKMEDEYVRDAELKKEDVEAIKLWAENQPHLPALGEIVPILFLKKCHYDREAAKKRLDDYLTMRTICRDLFTGFDPFSHGIQSAMRCCFQEMLPKKIPDGNWIYYVKVIDPNPESFCYKESVRYTNMTAELFLEQRGSTEGVVMLMDEENFTADHLRRIDFSLARKYMYMSRVAFPIRIKGVHVVNPSTFTDKILALVKPFVKQKTVQSFRIHRKMEDLHRHVPKECLPNEYGGSIGTIAELQDMQRKNFVDNAEFFAKLDEMVVDESRRPGKAKFEEDMFGVEGTFRKLNID